MVLFRGNVVWEEAPIILIKLYYNSWNPALAMYKPFSWFYSANARHWTNAGLMSVQRLQRLPNIKPALFQCLEFAVVDEYLRVFSD